MAVIATDARLNQPEKIWLGDVFTVKTHHIFDANVIEVLFNVIDSEEILTIFDPPSSTAQYIVLWLTEPWEMESPVVVQTKLQRLRNGFIRFACD